MKKYRKILFKLSILIFVILLTVPFIVSCSSEIEGVNPTAIINLIFPNIWVFVATIIASIILLSCIIWFIWKPMNAKLEARKKYLNKEMEDTEQAKTEAIKFKNDANQEYLTAQVEASKIIENASDKGNTLYTELQNQARNNAYEIIKGAQEQMALERREMQDEVHNKILDIAFDAVTHISKQKVTREENDKLVEEFLKDFEGCKD